MQSKQKITEIKIDDDLLNQVLNYDIAKDFEERISCKLDQKAEDANPKKDQKPNHNSQSSNEDYED